MSYFDILSQAFVKPDQRSFFEATYSPEDIATLPPSVIQDLYAVFASKRSKDVKFRYLNSVLEDPRNYFQNNPLMSKARENYIKDFEIKVTPIEIPPATSTACARCGSRKLILQSQFARSGDEAQHISFQCSDCLFVFPLSS